LFKIAISTLKEQKKTGKQKTHQSRRVFSIFKFSKLFPFSDFLEASSRKKHFATIFFEKGDKRQNSPRGTTAELAAGASRQNARGKAVLT
jgi:hypothetical protein